MMVQEHELHAPARRYGVCPTNRRASRPLDWLAAVAVWHLRQRLDHHANTMLPKLLLCLP